MRLNRDLLLERRDAIAAAVAGTGRALALLGQGSSGPALARLDDYSDLDLVVLAKPGCKQSLLNNLEWIAAAHPVAYPFRSSPDSYKILFEDGVLCELAIFDASETATREFAEGIWSCPGSVLWRDEAFEALRLPDCRPLAPGRTPDWLLGELLTNLYVGLLRERRGERLSATRFIQGYAIDRLIELSPLIEPEQPAEADPYTFERRYEQRFPAIARRLPEFMPGYDGNVASARALLNFLAEHFTLNPRIVELLRKLCDGHA